MKENIRESMIYGYMLESKQSRKGFISFNPVAIMDTLGGAFTHTKNALKSAFKMADEDKKKIKKALYNYEKQNPDLIKIADMTYKVFNLKKTLNFDDNKGADKGEEDTEDNPLYDEKIMLKMFGYKFKKDRRANRIVEYFYQDKPSIVVAYTVDTTVGAMADTIESNVSVSFANNKFAKHKEYYTAKAAYERGIIGKQISEFVAKYYTEEESTNESNILSEAKSSNYKVGDKITVEFKDKKFKAEITSNYKGDDIGSALSKIDSCISTFNGASLWNYLATHFKKGLENCDYWEDNKLTGKSLKDAIISIDYIHIDKFGDVVIVGDSKDDEEHGYEVVFPKGKFLKSPKEEYSKDIDEPGYQPKYTLISDGYYFQH